MATTQKKRIGSADIAAELRRKILRGELEPHDRLPPERELAESNNVSRGTVRGALNRLADEKLVEIRRGSGTYVIRSDARSGGFPFESARPLELIDARFALEPHICRLVVLHGRRADFEDLERLLERMESAEDDPVVFGEVDSDFHRRLAEATGNTLLTWLVRQVNSVRAQKEWMRMRQLTLEKGIIARYNAQHRQIVNAIRSREPERAAALMKAHLETARLSLTRAAET
ncbi:MAG: FadR/GntR family transcriptional regulator [Paracoccaceae bacterium]